MDYSAEDVAQQYWSAYLYTSSHQEAAKAAAAMLHGSITLTYGMAARAIEAATPDGQPVPARDRLLWALAHYSVTI